MQHGLQTLMKIPIRISLLMEDMGGYAYSLFWPVSVPLSCYLSK